MEKITLNNNEQEKIIGKIKEILLSKHPIIDDRFYTVCNYPSPQFDIDMYFINYENKDYTSILFLDGYENARTGNEYQIIINGLISPETINELIFNILLDHDYIRTSYLTTEEMNIEFGVDLRENNLKGINCDIIGLNLDFHSHPEKENLLNIYSDAIIKIYTPELNKAFGLSDKIKLKLTKH